MEPDSWTPARGWKLAMFRAGYRSLIAAGVAGVVVYLTWPTLAQAPPFMGLIVAVMAGSGAVGFPAGYLVARKLPERSGLAGRSLALPVVAMLVLTQLAACRLAGMLRGPGGMFVYALQAGLIVWSAIACARGLILD